MKWFKQKPKTHECRCAVLVELHTKLIQELDKINKKLPSEKSGSTTKENLQDQIKDMREHDQALLNGGVDVPQATTEEYDLDLLNGTI